jgi:phosphate transport system substrate-binding protein
VLDGRRALVASIGLNRTSPAAAFHAVARGRADVAVSTRPIEPPEQAELSRIAPLARPQDHEHVIALDALTVIVSPDRPLAALSVDKLAAIFAGKAGTWQELGMSGGRINIYVAGDAAGADDITSLILRSRELKLAPSARRLASEFEVSDAVTRDPDAIGLTSLAMLRNAKAAGITGPCGITRFPSEFAIKAEEYPLARRLYLYTAGEPVAVSARRLVSFANSGAAQAMIRDAQFMDQSVISSTASAESDRVKAWLASAAPSLQERAMARSLAATTADGLRLSLTFRFATGSSELDAKARQDPSRLAELLRSPAYKDKTIVLAGFTDSVGTPAANARLSMRRAEEVREALLAASPAGSLDPRRVVSTGFGPAAPVACDDGAEGNNRNRRVEVWVREGAPMVRAVDVDGDGPPVRRRKRKRSG